MNPEIAGIPVFAKEEITVQSPVNKRLVINLPDAVSGQEISIDCVDANGNVQMTKKLNTDKAEITLKCMLSPGVYTARFYTPHNTVSEVKFTKQ